MDKELSEKLVNIAIDQMQEGLKAKDKRMKTVATIIDLYNNKVMELGDRAMNIPFPIMSKQIDSYYAKIDEPPSLDFKIPNRKNLSEKIQQAFVQESSSTRSGWSRKDRAEKKLALQSGRGVCKVYASSVDNKYMSHYDMVDVYNFVADPSRGDLDAGQYHGEVNIFKTKTWVKKMAERGIYNKTQVEKLINCGKDTEESGETQATDNKKERLESLKIDVTKHAGQDGYNLVQWIMKHEEKLYYLLFDLHTGIWVRADEVKNVFKTKKTPYVSWATNYDEYAFWTKGAGDDILPVAEAMKFLLNTALENERRRGRPMRMIESGSLMDVNELIDYVPDNVIVTNVGKKAEIVSVETPEITTTINLVEFLNGMMESKAGVGSGTDEKDVKVGVYYGQLAEDADIIGTINKEYAEGYAHKGYRFFWGLKEHITEPIALEMLGKGGVKLAELTKFDLSNVGDVGDVEISGGAREQEIDAVQSERQAKVVAEISRAYPERVNPDWVIKTSLKREGFTEEDITRALDASGEYNAELMNEADESIQQILMGNTQKLNQGATPAFMERIFTYANDNLDYVNLDKNGNETGIDRKKKQQFDDLYAYARAHQQIAIENGQANIRQMQAQNTMQNVGGVEVPQVSTQQQRLANARPGETNIPPGTPGGTAQQSQDISNSLSV